MDVFDLARAAKVPQTFTLAEVRRKYGLTADQVRAVSICSGVMVSCGNACVKLIKLDACLGLAWPAGRCGLAVCACTSWARAGGRNAP